MPRRNLTVRAAQSAVALGGKRTAYYDTHVHGFLLVVYPSGKKVWQAVYRHRTLARTAG
jgi:hypothetical protein